MGEYNETNTETRSLCQQLSRFRLSDLGANTAAYTDLSEERIWRPRLQAARLGSESGNTSGLEVLRTRFLCASLPELEELSMAGPVLCLRGESACSFRLYLVHSTRPGRGPGDRCPANRRARSG